MKSNAMQLSSLAHMMLLCMYTVPGSRLLFVDGMQLLLGRLLKHGSAAKEIYSMFRDPYGMHCLIPMLLLQVPILYMNVYRASLGQRFCEDRIVGPPTAKCGLCRITSMYMYMHVHVHVHACICSNKICWEKG